MNIENNWNSDDDFFSQLTVEEIPPVPDEIETQVHHRVNAALLATHAFEFVFCALPSAFYTFGESLIYFLLLSLGGNTENETQREQL